MADELKGAGVLATYPMLPYLIDSLDRKFTIYKLWEAENREDFLAQHAHSIRGVACNGKIGVDAQLIDALPFLEIVATNSVGLDKVDLDKCRQRNISVAYTPDVVTDDVADLAIALMLDTLRHISVADRYVRQGLWPLKGDYKLTSKLSGKRVGIVGLGALIGNVCHAFMHGLNYTEVYGTEKLQEAIKNRPKGQPLITVSNHVASVDDPLVISSILPPRLLLDAKSIRWTLCATDRCFTNPVTSAFFRCVKVLPVARGDGIFQKGMDMALSKLNRGDWVHIFPEGSRSRDGGKTIGTAKRGIGRLVLDAERMPLVVPFVHTGMQEVMPIGSQFPHVSKKVVVLVGDPIKVDDLFMASKEQGFSEGKLYDAISMRVGEKLKELKRELDELVYQKSLQNRNTHNLHTIEMVNGISQFADWEENNLLSQKPLAEDGEDVSNLNEKTTSESVNQASESDGIHQRLGGLRNDPEKGYMCANDTSFHHVNVSSLQGFMDPSVLMGFAARGVLMNGKRELDEPITFHNWRHRILMQAGQCIG